MFNFARLEQGVQRGDHDQRQYRRGNHAADHRRGDAAHHFGAGAGSPHDGQQPGHDRHHRHHLWANPFDGTFHDCRVEIAGCRLLSVSLAFRLDPFPGVFQIDQHHHAGFRRHPGQRDEAHRHRHAQVVIEQPQQPHAADQRERHRQHHDQRFRDAPEVEIQQQKNNQQQADRGNDENSFLFYLELRKCAVISNARIVKKATTDSSGIVRKPNHSITVSEHGTPCAQGLILSGITPATSSR